MYVCMYVCTYDIPIVFCDYESDDTEEWLQCTNDKCGVWSHVECLQKVIMHNLCLCFVSNMFNINNTTVNVTLLRGRIKGNHRATNVM